MKIEQTNPDPVLEVNNLRKYYGQTRAVDGLSFSILPGKVYAILGPNGAGKTTTIEIIEGLRKKDEGEIIIFGKKVEDVGSDEKERIGVQLQETTFFPHLTVEETIKLFGNFFQKSIRLEEMLKIAMLEEKRKSLVESLSGGQKQRLALALALVNDPELVFLDEPTTGLDPQARRGIWDTITRLRNEGRTVILTTHYMEEAEQLSDYILIMDHGKIIAEGALKNLISTIGMKSVVEFEVKDVNAEKILSGSSIENVTEVEEGRYKIKTDNFAKTIAELSNISEANDSILKNITVRQPNLEDVFLNLTGRTLRE